MLGTCNYARHMSHVQIRNVPEDLHRQLKARAAQEGTTVSDMLLREIERLVERPAKREVLQRIASREPVRLSESAADVVRAERDTR